jgi:hypothetical protein
VEEGGGEFFDVAEGRVAERGADFLEDAERAVVEVGADEGFEELAAEVEGGGFFDGEAELRELAREFEPPVLSAVVADAFDEREAGSLEEGDVAADGFFADGGVLNELADGGLAAAAISVFERTGPTERK